MKKSLTVTCLIALATLAAPAFAKTELPFVGDALFSFGGNAAEQHIRIKDNGHTTITEHTRSGSTVVYEGAYQSYLPITEHGKTVGFYAIKGNEIHELDANKQPSTGCVAKENDNAPCVAELVLVIVDRK